jgi:hypothetical protein
VPTYILTSAPKTKYHSKICSPKGSRYFTRIKDRTEKKTQITRIREEIKHLYKKKDFLNESLYNAHLQAASEWGKVGN